MTLLDDYLKKYGPLNEKTEENKEVDRLPGGMRLVVEDEMKVETPPDEKGRAQTAWMIAALVLLYLWWSLVSQ